MSPSTTDLQILPLTAADLAECDWDQLLPDEPNLDVEERLAAGARKAQATGQARTAAALRLLADACSMMLDSDNPTRPFRPWWVDADGRSGPDLYSFTPDAIALFAEVAPDTRHPALRARLADIVWCRDPRRGREFADLAIEAYLCAPLEASHWQLNSRAKWLRATYLALSLRRTELVAVIERRLLEAIWQKDQQDEAPIGECAALVLRQGLAVEEHPKIVEHLAELASNLSKRARFREARELLAAAVDWLHRNGEAQRRAVLLAAIGQSWHDEALAATSAFTAAGSIDKAIQIYRSIPRKYRAALGIDERVYALQLERLDAGERLLENLGLDSSGQTDIDNLVSASIEHVAGKNTIDALRGLATVWVGAKVEETEQRARKLMAMNDFPELARRRTTMAHDGRVISKINGADPVKDDARVLFVQMLDLFRINMRLAVQGSILPVLAHITFEHPLNLHTFIELARDSVLIPPDHVHRIGRALYFGYTRDFETSLQYLASEIESIVRYHLKASGVVTINTDMDGVQMELGLSTLARMPQMEEVFGKDLAFEIKAVFCEQDGSNLRNDVAHGLISDGAGYSIDSIYAWWFVFRLVILTNPYTRDGSNQEEPSAKE